MPKLGKTAEKMLADALKNGRVCVSRGQGRGADGGLVSYGKRNVQAAISLVRAGLIVMHGEPQSHRYTQRGWTVHHSDMMFVPVTK